MKPVEVYCRGQPSHEGGLMSIVLLKEKGDQSAPHSLLQWRFACETECGDEDDEEDRHPDEVGLPDGHRAEFGE